MQLCFMYITQKTLPYSAKRWQHKTLANQQNIALVKKLWQIANLEDQAEI